MFLLVRLSNKTLSIIHLSVACLLVMSKYLVALAYKEEGRPTIGFTIMTAVTTTSKAYKVQLKYRHLYTAALQTLSRRGLQRWQLAGKTKY